MVKSTEADIVCPTVTTEDELIFLSGIICILKEVLSGILSLTLKACSLKSGNKSVGSLGISSGILIGIKPSLSLCSN